MNPLLLIALIGGAAALFFAQRKPEFRLSPGRHRITATVDRPPNVAANVFAVQLKQALLAGGAQQPIVTEGQPMRLSWITPVIVTETAFPEFVPLTLPSGPVAVRVIQTERMR